MHEVTTPTNFQPFTFTLANSVPLTEWQRTRSWTPDVHFTGNLTSPAEVKFVSDLLNKYGSKVVAHWYCQPSPKMYSIELQFGEDEASFVAARDCEAEYNGAFSSNGKLKKEVADRYE